jgi:hypothetical protein
LKVVAACGNKKRRTIVASTKRRYSKEEFARRGDALYEKEIGPHLKAGDKGKFLAIDIETGAYEIGRSELRVGDRLRARVPEAQIWMVRVGFPYVHSFGGRPRRGTP